MHTRIFTLLLASATVLSAADRAWTRETVQPFHAGARAVMDLSVGDYRIVQGQDDKVKVRWSTQHAHDMDQARVEMALQGDTLRIKTRGPKDNFKVVIELPRRTDLDARLSIGQLFVSGLEGNKRLDVNIGEAIVEVPDPKAYRQATASVRLGDLKATPFGHRQDGFMNRFTWKGEGTFLLQAKVGIGELTFR